MNLLVHYIDIKIPSDTSIFVPTNLIKNSLIHLVRFTCILSNNIEKIKKTC